MKITEHIEDKASVHWFEKKVHAYIYQDVFDEPFFNKLKNSIKVLFKNNSITYKTHRTTFVFDGENQKIVSHGTNKREQQVVYDLTFEDEWFYQTKDTVKEWSNKWLMNNINPVFYKYLQFFEGQPPFNYEPNCWVPIRWHANVLSYDKFLSSHFDMNDQYFNTKSACYAKAFSVTFYLDDQKENTGGEFWSESGFVYRPKINTGLCVNGNEVHHGVNCNMDLDDTKKDPRMAFTTRWAHIDDLLLPGHPSKLLYKLENSYDKDM
jgi:hypothetical protein